MIDWNDRQTFQKWTIGNAADPVPNHIDHGCPAWMLGPILKRSVNRQRMMKDAFPGFQLNGNR